MSSVYFGTSFIGILINLLIFKYVYDLEDDKCLCSKDWKRKYIKYFSAILVASGLLSFVIKFLPNVKMTYAITLLMSMLGSVFIIASVVYLYALYMFSHDLIKHKECPCSENNLRTFVYYYSIIVLIAVAFSVVISITTTAVLSRLLKNN